MNRLTRRDLLKTAAITPFASPLVAADSAAKLPVAAVVTVYKRNSHADVIVGKVLEGYEQDGGPGPNLKIVSMYTDQVPGGDLSRGLAQKHGFRIAKTIDEAITLGTDKVQVAGVLSIGEHGDYPTTPDTGQKKYPRRRFFDGIAAAFRRCDQVVPVFSDKHLSWNWKDASHVYRTANDRKIPLMAGSSIPVAWRMPPVALPKDCEIEGALAIGYGGLESYGFHALEGLQCMVERRRGGETGVKSVQAVRGDNIWQSEKEGRWSRKLLDAVLDVIPEVPAGDPDERLEKKATFYLIEHRDGLRTAVAMANGLARHFGVAVKLRGRDEPIATWFKLQEERPYGHFAFLLRAINRMFHTGTPAWPVERTLLTTGILDSVMQGVASGGERHIATPHLGIQYTAADWPFANGPE